VTLEDGLLALAVGSQTNVIVELSAPVTVTRPLGRRGRATTLRFLADDPAAAVRALRAFREGESGPRAGVGGEQAA
jgi:acyl transferase domain-containing protein